MTICCVPGCFIAQRPVHRFPCLGSRDPNKRNLNLMCFRLWLQRIQNPKLEHMTHAEIYKRCMVCDKHFSEQSRQVNNGRYLKFGALPTLNLPDFTQTPTEKNSLVWDAKLILDSNEVKLENGYEFENCPIITQENLKEFGEMEILPFPAPNGLHPLFQDEGNRTKVETVFIEDFFKTSPQSFVSNPQNKDEDNALQITEIPHCDDDACSEASFHFPLDDDADDKNEVISVEFENGQFPIQFQVPQKSIREKRKTRNSFPKIRLRKSRKKVKREKKVTNVNNKIEGENVENSQIYKPEFVQANENHEVCVENPQIYKPESVQANENHEICTENPQIYKPESVPANENPEICVENPQIYKPESHLEDHHIDEFLQQIEDQQKSKKTSCPKRPPYFKALKVQENFVVMELCRICLYPIMDDNFIKLYGRTGDFFLTMVQKILPQVDFQLYSNQVICGNCYDVATSVFKLRETATATELRLFKLIQEKGDVMVAEEDLLIIQQYEADVQEVVYATPKAVEAPKPKQNRILDVSNDEIIVNDVDMGDVVNGSKLGEQTEQIAPWEIENEKNDAEIKVWSLGETFDKTETPSKSDEFPSKSEKFPSKSEESPVKAGSDDQKEETGDKSCNVCWKTFRTVAARKRHSRVHKDKSFFCHICGKAFTYKSNLNVHVKNHDTETKHLCHLCGKHFNTKDKLKQHVRRHNEPKFTCKICEANFKTKSGFKNHVEGEHGKEPSQDRTCEFCLRVLKNKKLLLVHKVDMHGWNPDVPRSHFNTWQCHICFEEFNVYVDKKKHLERHERSEYLRINCELCPKVFLREKFVVNHVKLKHFESPWRLTCLYCKEIFGLESSLASHTENCLEKTEELPNEPEITNIVTCKICDKSFRLNSLTNHLQKYHNSDSWEFKCESCEEAFPLKSLLKEHIFSEHGEKGDEKPPKVVDTWNCPLCNRQFTNRFSKTRHLRTHEPPKYQCTFCTKRFKEERVMIRHANMVHRPNVDWKINCELCLKRFATKDSLEYHKRVIHKYECVPNELLVIENVDL